MTACFNPTSSVAAVEMTLRDSHVADFRRALRGEVITADHDGYEQARRVWNGNIDRRPALVARCVAVADVQRAVELAATHNLRLSVRGGGSSFSRRRRQCVEWHEVSFC
jgi:hypothetical protein